MLILFQLPTLLKNLLNILNKIQKKFITNRLNQIQLKNLETKILKIKLNNYLNHKLNHYL